MWTQRDIEIVRALCVKVRLLTVEQIEVGWWDGCKQSSVHAIRRLSKLLSANLLQCYRVNAHALLPISKPLFSWAYGTDAPDTAVLSEKAQSRWTKPGKPTIVYSATPLAANLFASFAGRLPRPSEFDHDLLLAQVYVHYLSADPGVAKDWSGEDTRKKAGRHIKDPDVFVYDGQGGVRLIIESAGRYTARQIEAFHYHCVKYSLAYELW